MCDKFTKGENSLDIQKKIVKEKEYGEKCARSMQEGEEYECSVINCFFFPLKKDRKCFMHRVWDLQNKKIAIPTKTFPLRIEQSHSQDKQEAINHKKRVLGETLQPMR